MGKIEDFLPAALGGIGGFFLGGPAGAALGAGIGQSYTNANLTRETNALNQAEAQKQMDFQAQMSNTAHQREKDDLLAAGLNPTLSAGGNGSSTPSGAAAGLTAPKIELPDMMAYGVSIKQLEQADRRLDIEDRNSTASIAKSLSDTDLNKMKKILLQKGMVRAELEGEGSKILKNILQFLKKGAREVPNLQKMQPDQQLPSGKLGWYDGFYGSGPRNS